MVTTHDGRVRPEHPIVRRAVAEVQSATSLRLMLRDPLAFIWRYALGWRSTIEDDQPLSLDARTFGELVHELLKQTVDALELRVPVERDHGFRWKMITQSGAT